MSHEPAPLVHDPTETAFAALASASPDAEWIAVDARSLPRHAYDLVIAFARARIDAALDDLVSLRNALTREGRLLVVLAQSHARDDVHDLVRRAGFTRVRELPTGALGTLELRR